MRARVCGSARKTQAKTTPSVIPPSLPWWSLEHPLGHSAELKYKLATLCGVQHIPQQWRDLAEVVHAWLELGDTSVWVDIPDVTQRALCR